MPRWWPAAETGRADFRLRQRDTPEKRLQRAGRELAAWRGFRAWHLSQARATQQSPGWADDVFTGGRRLLAVEWKVRPNVQTTAQAAFQAAWEASGGVYALCYTLEDLERALQEAIA